MAYTQKLENKIFSHRVCHSRKQFILNFFLLWQILPNPNSIVMKGRVTMSDKACLTNQELELTQKIQVQFPRGVAPDTLEEWNKCPAKIL
ncbi:MAG: hypothetical protein WCV41_02695, partial [Patescibacteria group bacterium]